MAELVPHRSRKEFEVSLLVVPATAESISEAALQRFVILLRRRTRRWDIGPFESRQAIPVLASVRAPFVVGHADAITQPHARRAAAHSQDAIASRALP
jgi:hypothetical protein